MKQLFSSILFAISIIITLSIVSCKKAKQYMNNAEITGIDNRLTPCLLDDPCSCPGGYFIHIDNLPGPNGQPFRAMQLPKNFDPGNNLQFPIAVKIDWRYDALLCDSSRIV